MDKRVAYSSLYIHLGMYEYTDMYIRIGIYVHMGAYRLYAYLPSFLHIAALAKYLNAEYWQSLSP